VITPRTTRLVRVPDLRAMHAAVAGGLARPADRHHQAIIVPTHGAADELRRTLETLRLSASSPVLVLPDIVTRADFYGRLHNRFRDAPALLSEFEREVILRRAARDTVSRGVDAPFQLRPGLIVEILSFYDDLRRRGRTLDDFERLMVGTLQPSADTDRGAERMLRQTDFLAAALAEFERRVAATGRMDEHGLRTLLLARACEPSYCHVVVTVADQASDASGLWPADFDLLSRMPGVERLDVIATESLLASGLYERIHAALPGIEEARAGARGPLPVLAVPELAQGEDAVRWFVSRDREEELASIARAVVCDETRSPDDTAVVFQRPLPYLYLARQVFGDARLPYHALDSLPLAGEPFVAALDLLFSFVIAEGTRASLVALLRSPHWSFEDGGRPVASGEVSAADELLQEIKYHGGFEWLSALASETEIRAAGEGGMRKRRASLWTRAAGPIRAANAAARELRAAADAPSASAQIRALLAFVRSHERLPAATDSWGAGHARARAAVVSALESLADAHERHDDEPLPFAELSAGTRRWIEGQTFSPRTGTGGVRLLDAQAAAYADVQDLRLVGLVESDWPERTRRSIFYPASLLGQLGWPADGDRLAAARARFQDLLTLPAARVSLSTFTLEDDSIVPPSTFLEDVEAAGLPVERVPPLLPIRVFMHEALAEDPIVADALPPDAARWLALRAARSPASGAAFRGSAGPRTQASYAVSYVERYLECPFKYFAAYVLRLPEEREDESGLTPREQGQFLHEVFQAFFSEWHASGHRAITTANVRDALVLFERVTEDRLQSLAEADRALERTHLLGSAAAPGLAERAFAFEMEQGGDVLERLLEHELEGRFEFRAGETTRQVELRAKADRIDLMTDGTLRVIDYKLSKAPKAARALQLPIYGLCAEQHLKGRYGRDWTLARAGYVAFKEKNPFVPLGPGSLEEALAAGQARFLEAVAAIEAGAFPVDPDEPYRCQWCAYPTVCRKDYVGDE
jgi:RecB family exonuclease